jgi:Zn-dependent protease with chaperone function
MSYDVYLPFVVAAVFGTAGVRLARRLRPAQATWLLTCGAVTTSLCSLCSLMLLAWALLARFSVVTSVGDWSTAAFRRHDPVSLSVSIPAANVLGFVCWSTARALVRHARMLAQVHRTCSQLPAAIGELVVVADDRVDACALPGRPGRILVSQRVLATLSPTQRAAVLAHERSHLRHRHHLHQVAVALAAAAVPLLRAVPRATSYAIERWADDDAATALHAPEAVAGALCQAGAGQWTPTSAPARRITALQRPQRRGGWTTGWVIVTVSVAGFMALIVTSAEATTDAGQLAQRTHGPAATPGVHATHERVEALLLRL